MTFEEAQPISTDCRKKTNTSKTNGSQATSGQRPAASSEARIEPSSDKPALSSRRGSCASPKARLPSGPDETLTLVIAEATALAQEAQSELDARAAKREADFLEMVRQQAVVLGVTPARGFAAAIAGKPAPRSTTGGIDLRSVVRPKYRDPLRPDEDMERPRQRAALD